MKVSIIVTIYNLEKYIEECINSILNQTYKNIEIIAVNDGSIDDSQSILENLSKKSKKLKIFNQKNNGVSSARNLGIEKSTGDYLMFVDGDDFIDEKIVEKLVDLTEKENLDIACADIIKIYEKGSKEYYKTMQDYSDKTYKNYIIGDSGPCAKLFKKELFKTKKFRKIAYEDLDIIPQLAMETEKIGYLSEGLYFYRQLTGSAMRLVKFKESMLDIFVVLDNIYKKMNDKYNSEIEYIYISHLLRTTTLRMIEFKEGKESLNEIIKIMQTRFSKWKKNVYYRKSSFKMKIICNLAYYKQWWALKIIKNIFKK